MENAEIVKYMNYLIKTYDEVTRIVTKTKQRLASLPGAEDDLDCDSLLKGEGKAEGLLTVKGRIERAIGKELPQWDVWQEWLLNVPGIGPVLGAKLIMLFNYRFVPVCKKCGGLLDRKEGAMICRECGAQAKDGLLTHRMEARDFPTISKWWAFMGRHTVDGVMPKARSGCVSNWSAAGRVLGYHIGEQFNRQSDDHPYKAILIQRKKMHARKHPDWTKGHIHKAAKNEVVKIFLAHFWTVSRTIEGKDVSLPYAGAVMGHTNMIKPPYWPDIAEDGDARLRDYPMGQEINQIGA